MRSGRPIAEVAYTKRWRAIADAAGLPKEIWNRDFRAAKHAAHADPNFTAKVYGRGVLEASRKVALARVKGRKNAS